MAKNRSSFIFYHDWLEVFKSVEPDVAVELLQVLVNHSSGNGKKHDNPLVNVAFSSFRLQLDRDIARWVSTQKERIEAGKEGQRQKQANANKSKQMLTNASKC